MASSSVEPLPGYDKKLTVKPDMLLSQVQTAEYDAIVFMAGYRYDADNVDAIRIAKEGAAEGKVLAAMSWGISTLIKADLLKGKRVASISDQNPFIQKAGGTISAGPVELGRKNQYCQPYSSTPKVCRDNCGGIDCRVQVNLPGKMGRF